jgi:hypothetical protein
VELYARKSPFSEWVKIPELPVTNPIYIGALRCSTRDTLYPGEEMKASPTAFSRNRIKGNHTFEVWLAEYDFSTEWEGEVNCKIVQELFGGGTFKEKRPDGYSAKIESPSFNVKLPLHRKDVRK